MGLVSLTLTKKIKLDFGKLNQANIHFSVPTLVGGVRGFLLPYRSHSWALIPFHTGGRMCVYMCVCVLSSSSCPFLSDQFETLRVEAVPLSTGHGLQQSLLLLRAAG